jgi:hypothetical protein
MGSGTPIEATSGRQMDGFTHPEERACSLGFRAPTAGIHTSSYGIPAGWGVLMGGSAGPGIGRSMGDWGWG